MERAVPQAFVRDGGALRAIQLADGREVACDLAILAIGQAKLRSLVESLPGVKLDDKGRAVADPLTGATGNAKVWAGGDAIGGELVVTAAQDGKRAARGICAALGVTVRPDSPIHAGHR